MSAKGKARNALTLKKKIELIEVAKKNSSRALAEKFGCSKMQVNSIISKEKAYQSNMNQMFQIVVFSIAKRLVHVSLLN